MNSNQSNCKAETCNLLIPGNNFFEMNLSTAQQAHLDRLVASNRFPNGFASDNTVSFWVSDLIVD